MQKKLTMQIIIQSRLRVFYIYTKNQEAHYCTIFYPKQIQQIITHLPIPTIRNWWSQCRVLAVVTAIHDEWDDQILCELTHIGWQPQSSVSCYFRFGWELAQWLHLVLLWSFLHNLNLDIWLKQQQQGHLPPCTSYPCTDEVAILVL